MLRLVSLLANAYFQRRRRLILSITDVDDNLVALAFEIHWRRDLSGSGAATGKARVTLDSFGGGLGDLLGGGIVDLLLPGHARGELAQLELPRREPYHCPITVTANMRLATDVDVILPPVRLHNETREGTNG